MKMIIKVAAIILCIAVIFTGCSGPDWAAKCGDDTMPAGMYISYLMSAYTNSFSMVSDTDTDIFKQQIEGQDAADWMISNAKSEVSRYYAVKDLFDEYSLSLDSDTAAYVDYVVDYQWGYYGSIYESNGVSKSSMHSVIESNARESELFNYLYGADGIKAVSDEELGAVFADNYMKYRLISIDKGGNETQEDNASDDSSGNDDVSETEADPITLLTGYKDRVEAGESFEQIIYEYNGDETAQFTSGMFDTISLKESGALPEQLEKKLAEAEPGSLILHEGDETVYLIQPLDILENHSDIEYYRSQLVSLLKGDEYEEMIKQKSESLSVEFNEAAIKKYSPKSIKL